jgi:hypothetical protein
VALLNKITSVLTLKMPGNWNSSQLPAACRTTYALVRDANIITIEPQATQTANLWGWILFLPLFSFKVKSIFKSYRAKGQ